eukprot:scaffold5980_cov376-Prasinococcus_capsulatus_cf.AAC.11
MDRYRWAGSSVRSWPHQCHRARRLVVVGADVARSSFLAPRRPCAAQPRRGRFRLPGGRGRRWPPAWVLLLLPRRARGERAASA